MRFTTPDVVRRTAQQYSEDVAVRILGEPSMTYGQLATEVELVAQALVACAARPPHVAVMLPNCNEWITAVCGAGASGWVAVLLNPRLRDAELLYQVEQSDAQVLVAGETPGYDIEASVRLLSEQLPHLNVVWVGKSVVDGTVPWSEWLSMAPGRAVLPPPAERDPAVIIYTSGTTALPKGVVLDHQAVVRNAMQVARSLDVRRGDRVFAAGPFFHSGGLTMHVMTSLVRAAEIHSVPRFEPAAVLRWVSENRCTHYSGIETLFLRLLEAPDFGADSLRSVRTGWTTGSPEIIEKIAREIGIQGVVGVYGLSEAAPNVTISDHDDSEEHRWGTVGRAQPWTRVDIREPDHPERAAPPGTMGEIAVSGYHVMQGYYDKPDETRAALRDGWLHTGDLGRLRPDGYLEFGGRLKDVVRVGGENVSCLEVEDALYALPGIDLAAVLPVTDASYGEVPLAVISVSRAELQDQEAVLGALRRSLAGYKVPRRVVYVDSMPLTESGKVQKGQLREQIFGSGGGVGS
jgi:acyl-CoA synthetase (AMP-forming)/AMP-acid ligase II